jgi:exportin-5
MSNELNELINAWKLCNSGTKQDNQQQAFNFIENFKQNSQNILESGFSILNNNTIQPELIHFGTQLITHTIKFKWNNLAIEKKLFIKNSLYSLIDNLNENSSIFKFPYLKTSVCLTYLELIKREWPQNWPSLLDELYQISSKSFQHLNFILNLFKLMADEFVLNNINLPVSRRKDINQYLNANMQQIFDFFLNTLESSYRLYMKHKQENPHLLNENHIVVSLLQACFECLSYYVDWIQIQIVLSRNALLIELVLNLLNDQYVCIHSAKCLIVLVSRRGQANDRKPLLGLFSSTALNQIFDCIKLSFMSCTSNKNYKELLKYLLQILIEMGMQLCYLWNDSSFVKPNELNIYLCAIYEFTINESKVFFFIFN